MDIFQREKEKIGSLSQAERDELYKAAVSLMSIQLRSMIISSINDYIQLFFAQHPPRFAQSMILDSATIMRHDPSVPHFLVALSSVVDVMAGSLAKITPLHVWFEGLAGQYLRVAPDAKFIENAKLTLNARLTELFATPLAALEELKVHQDLLRGGLHDMAVQNFLSEERKFDEYKTVCAHSFLSIKSSSQSYQDHCILSSHCGCDETHRGARQLSISSR